MYQIARLSTVRMIVDTAATLGYPVDYFEWDAHGEKFKLPEKDLVGLIAFSCSENDGFHDLTFGVVIMTHDDPGLIRATEMIDTFYKRLGAMKKYPMFNQDGSETGFEAVCFDGTSASPMARVDARPTSDVQVSARVTRAGEWPPRPR